MKMIVKECTIYVIEYYYGLWRSFVTEDFEEAVALAKKAEHYCGRHLFKMVKVTMESTPANIAKLACMAARKSTDIIEAVSKYPGWKTEVCNVKITILVEETS